MSRFRRVVGAVGLATPTLVAIGAGAYLYTLTHQVIHYEKIGAGDVVEPHTRYVEISAIAHPNLQVVHHYGRGNEDTEYFVPLAPPHWDRRTPIIYFWHTDRDYSTPGRGTRADDDSAFAVVESGALVRRVGMADSFSRKGVTLAAFPAVLDTDPFRDKAPLIILLILDSVPLIISWAMMLSGYLGMRKRRKAQAG